jgi:hypothetical protein
MKNKKSKALSQYSKPELIKIIRGIEKDYHNLQISHDKLLKYSASLRYCLRIELDERTSENFWDRHLEDILDDEFEDDVEEELLPEHVRKRLPVDKKKEIDGYS